MYKALLTACLLFAYCNISGSPAFSQKQLTIPSTPSSVSLSKEACELKLKIIEDSAHSDTYWHFLKSVDQAERIITLSDESLWKIGYLYKGDIENWQEGQRLKISQHSKAYSNDIRIENVDTKTVAWGELKKLPTKNDLILRISQSALDIVQGGTIILSSGFIFKGEGSSWKTRDPLFIFHSNDQEEGMYDLWNLRTQQLSEKWRLVGNEKKGSSESILNLSHVLNQKILGQTEAISIVSNAIVRCWSGLNDPKLPIAVFLFLGPSGVGKTELAKVLNYQIYKNNHSLLRFDMSHFADPHSITRLIGSPPGYVNHEEGGQLTEALRKFPRSIVLLDEIEKASPIIRKFFLPVFDEGIIKDAKNRLIPCNKSIFVLTSNLCSSEIVKLYERGYTTEEIKDLIEPTIMEYLSPELYNRVSTIIFRPITPDLMDGLVDLMLKEVKDRFLQIKKVKVHIGPGVKEYLIRKGFHSTLGARPLKRLIQEQIVGSLAYAMIEEGIPENSSIEISYNNDQFLISWSVSIRH